MVMPVPMNLDHKVLQELGKEHALSILEILFSRGPRTASEVARELDIHISTSQAYLESLMSIGLIGASPREGRKGLIEYTLLNTKMNITIDIAKILEARFKQALGKAEAYRIRERAGAKVTYEWDEPSRRILAINIMERSKAFGRLGVAQTIKLSDAEGSLLWYLPQSTEGRKSVAELAKTAGLSNFIDIIQIIDLIEMLAQMRLIDLSGGTKG